MIRENQILLIFDYFSSFVLYWNYIFKREVRYYVELPFWVTLVFPSFQNVFVQTLLIGSVYEVDCMLSLSIYLITFFFLNIYITLSNYATWLGGLMKDDGNRMRSRLMSFPTTKFWGHERWWK